MIKTPASPRQKFLTLLIFLLLIGKILIINVPRSFGQESDNTIVKVGWYNSPFNTIDEFGRRTGYAYEYQQKIAAYTGWDYEYIEDSWSNLLEMLENGEIDLLSDVSYTNERAELILYPSLPMGSESYYLFVSNENKEITPRNFSSLNGKRIGVNKGSIQENFFIDWCSAHNIAPEIVELTTLEEESVQMLMDGALDALILIEGYGAEDNLVPVTRVGSSDFYFAVNKNRPDLLHSLDFAMNRIFEDDRYYNMMMTDKYLQATRTDAFISPLEADWLSKHGTIRIGYRDNYLPISANDKETGEVSGALKDYLEIASESMKNTEIKFEAIPYNTIEDGLKALQNGEIDSVFPVNLSAYEGETMNIMMTIPVMDTEMHAVIRSEDRLEISPQHELTVAVNRGNNNYEVFVKEHFPHWKIAYYDDTEEGFNAIDSGEADCLLVSNYRILRMREQIEKNRLSTITTGKSMSFSFAVRKTDRLLYSIMNKTANLVPKESIDLALLNHSYDEKKVSLSEFLRDNWAGVIAGMSAIFVVIISLLLQRLRAERDAIERQKLITATELDPLTRLYNRNFFFEYANRIYKNNPQKPMDAIVINIEQFHTVNAINGREFGDSVLKLLGKEIITFLQETEGIAGRFEADRFDIYCVPQENYQDIFARFQVKLNEYSSKANLRIRMGVMPWESGLEPVQLFDRARTACNMARGSFKNRLMIFNDEMRQRELFEQQLQNDLRRAIEQREFEIYFQPKYDIQRNTPKMVSAEALVRWRHPELGMIPPDEFIPLFERNGQISVVDNFVWAETAHQIARWRDKFGVIIPVSVNLSRVDVFDPSLEPTLDELLAQNGLEHSSFKLEVTESAYVEDSVQVVRVIKRLRDKGFEIEMDDFGSGYSSLNMLSSMPIDILKMDKAFVMNIEHSKKDIQLVELILDIANSLKVPVVAEGVETEQQMLLLKNLGCAMVQGFYFSKPLPAKEFEKIIISNI
ncbi:MAG: EAL domain-containing protein [Anaerolineaceae bacterium]|nr:EAL domain-containing protein [Anaerolineaceae bacterium]